MLTIINGLYRIIEALIQTYQMVRNSTKILVACAVLGLMNQACAVNGAPRESSLLTTADPERARRTTLPTDASDSRTISGTNRPAAAVDPLRDSAETSAPGGRPAHPGGAAAVGASTTTVPDVASLPSPALHVAASEAAQGRSKDAFDGHGLSADPTPPLRGTTEPENAGVPSLPSAQSPMTSRAQASLPLGASSGPYRHEGELDDLVQGYRTHEDGSFALQASEDDAESSETGSLWARVRAGFRMEELDSPLVERYEAWYTRRPEYLQRIIERGKRYLHFIVEEVEKRDMPLEIALLPMIESAYNPTAYSKAHAAGMWQFIPTTGKLYGLEQNWWYDGRRDVLAATRAALDYLQKLHTMFGDWHLALAAYNWGEGAVARAIAKNERRGLPTDYGSLRMPAETRNYVPKLLAVKNIVADPERFGLALDDVPDEPYFIRVAAPGNIDFKRVAQLAEVPVEELKSLNPAYNRPVITSSEGQTLLLPADKAEVFTENLKANDRPLVSWQAYKVHRSEKLSDIAAQFGTSVDLLQQVNGIKANGRLRAGSTLLVPRQPGNARDVRANRIDIENFQPPVLVSETRYHRVAKGETLSGIARKYGVSVTQLSKWNGLRRGAIRAGQKLRLQAHAGTSAPATPHKVVKHRKSSPATASGHRAKRAKVGAAGACCAKASRKGSAPRPKTR